ncbi:hypothetical protein [Streptomyces sp. JJ36]|uniref:hypothetical protein n=1 Tax=Streptomyces sp. JJ36 TaxID=2736645 RepID=UPI001F1E9E73|nr:hypothetical protein [Streptomyces sp. JJ36]MCF6523075.1 hypothetical protein [Streptomyces sp. JJ36]
MASGNAASLRLLGGSTTAVRDRVEDDGTVTRVLTRTRTESCADGGRDAGPGEA